MKNTTAHDPLHLPGLRAPRVTIESQGAYHLTSARIRKALRIPHREWTFSVNQFYDKYGFTITAWLEKSYTV